MQTFQDSYTDLQQISGDASATMLLNFKRWYNQGKTILLADLGRYFTRAESTFDVTAAQQYYSMPPDCIRMTGVIVTVNSVAYPLQEVYSEQEWRFLNATSTNSSTIPTFFFVRGAREFGIYPVPATTLTSGGSIYYEARERDFSQDDYATGTITTTNGSTAIAGSGTTFTANMVGRSLVVNDGSSDGLWYRIGGFTSTTVIALENDYGGAAGSGKTYRIGEVSILPEDCQDYPVTYAMWQFSKYRRDMSAANEYQSIWASERQDAKTRYARKTSSRIIHGKRIDLINTGLQQVPSNITG